MGLSYSTLCAARPDSIPGYTGIVKQEIRSPQFTFKNSVRLQDLTWTKTKVISLFFFKENNV